MDIVVLFNGLGNQMSQYAFYLAKKRNNSHCQVFYDTKSFNGHNGYELGKIFGIQCDRGLRHAALELLYRFARTGRLHKLKLLFKNLNVLYEARNYDYNPELLLTGKSRGFMFYYGGWHSEKYFLSVEKEIRDTFVFPSIIDEDCIKVKEMICNSNESVSLHVRRGDYLSLSSDDYYQFDGVSTIDYYRRAINFIKDRVSDCNFFIFSNDLEWCRREFSDLNAFFVGCNSGENSWRDMYLMTLCKHHINANSTFSWWGAWLSSQNGITICPQMFLRTVETKDIYPDNWIKM